MATIDWTGCKTVRFDPETMSGEPVIGPTRVSADAVFLDYEMGSDLEELHENYPKVPVEDLKSLIEYGTAHKMQPQP